MIDFLQYIVNGISVGSLYALVAVGYSMVFGILKFVNFAHGDLYMLGAYLVMGFGLLSAPFWLAIVLGLLFCGLVSVVINSWVYQRVNSSNRLILLISAVAVSLFLENFVQLVFTPEVREFPFTVNDDVIFLGEKIVIRVVDLWVTAFSITTALSTWAFVKLTRLGRGIQAIASNRYAAVVVGVPIDQMVSLTFFIGALLATLAGTLQSMIVNQVEPFMGVSIGLKAFSAAVLGGVGSIWGAVIGGFLLGTMESVLIGMGYSAWKDGVAFFLLILLLFTRPQGLLGEKELIKI